MGQDIGRERTALTARERLEVRSGQIDVPLVPDARTGEQRSLGGPPVQVVRFTVARVHEVIKAPELDPGVGVERIHERHRTALETLTEPVPQRSQRITGVVGAQLSRQHGSRGDPLGIAAPQTRLRSPAAQLAAQRARPPDGLLAKRPQG